MEEQTVSMVSLYIVNRNINTDCKGPVLSPFAVDVGFRTYLVLASSQV